MSSIKELQKEWYEILRKNDFIDIEDTSVTGFEIGPLANGSGHPLKTWTGISIDIEDQRGELHSLLDQIIYQEPLEEIKSSFPEPLFIQEQELLLMQEELGEIAEWIVKHGNRKTKKKDVMEIWDMHVNGFSSRKIADALNLNCVTVWRVVSLLTKWAKYE